MFVVHDILAFIATVQWHKNSLSLIIISKVHDRFSTYVLLIIVIH